MNCHQYARYQFIKFLVQNVAQTLHLFIILSTKMTKDLESWQVFLQKSHLDFFASLTSGILIMIGLNFFFILLKAKFTF